MTTTEHLCELGCGRPAPTTTICQDCADHPRHAINQFTPEDLQRLYAIALGEEQNKDVAARNGNSQPTSEPPINLDIYQLADDISIKYPIQMEELAVQPKKKAIRQYWKIIGDCEKAQAIINGHHIEYSENQHEEAYKELSDPKTYDELIEWFWEKLRIRISHNLLYQWKFQNKITPVDGPDIHPPRFRPRSILEIMR